MKKTKDNSFFLIGTEASQLLGPIPTYGGQKVTVLQVKVINETLILFEIEYILKKENEDNN